MRIAVGGIHIESCTFNPVLTRERDFRILRGPEILTDPAFAFFGEFNDVEFLPTIHCRALPGGPVERVAYEKFRTEFSDRLAAAGPVDGVYLAMHGAMFVENMEDAEGDWFEAARTLAGPSTPIATSYDLHGNVSRRVIDSIDAFAAYRTAPHIDVRETMTRAVRILVDSLRSKVRTHVAWAPVPVLLSGERTSTVDEPAASLYSDLPGLSETPGIHDVSLLVGYVWADEPRATASVVVTGTDPAAMEREAVALAKRYWKARERFEFGSRVGTIEECLDLAMRCPPRPVILADSGDNPTGGGVGDRPDVVRAMIAHECSGALVAGIADAPATLAAHTSGPGAELNLSVGATLDPSSGPAVPLRAKVLAVSEDRMGREALLDAKGIRIVVADRRRPYHELSDFARLGIDPRNERLVVVKSGYLSPALASIANPGVMALSPGVIDQDVTRTPRHRLNRPMFPFDRDFDWTPSVIRSKRAP